MDIEFSKDQDEAIDAILTWYKSHTSELPAFIAGGAAGTGKSTIISHLPNLLPLSKIHYCSYTGKASLVLRRKLEEFGISHDSVSTVHALMYKPILDESGEVSGWERKRKLQCDLIIVDEASMIPEFIYKDLLTYGIPVLFVGDHYQLPPVSSDEFNLMDNPFVKLDKPHRFSENSPIVKLATRIRNGETINFGVHGSCVAKKRIKDLTTRENDLFFRDKMLKTGESIILCGFNKTRVDLNKRIRKEFGYSGLLNNYERVICLKNNRKSNIPLYNGAIGTVKHIQKKFEKAIRCYIHMDGFDGNFRGNIYKDIFNTEKPEIFKTRSKDTQCFDYGYAISCHKSQGSSWKRVCVFEEQCSLWDSHRWLYTAVTRAEKELLIVKN